MTNQPQLTPAQDFERKRKICDPKFVPDNQAVSTPAVLGSAINGACLSSGQRWETTVVSAELAASRALGGLVRTCSSTSPH